MWDITYFCQIFDTSEKLTCAFLHAAAHMLSYRFILSRCMAVGTLLALTSIRRCLFGGQR